MSDPSKPPAGPTEPGREQATAAEAAASAPGPALVRAMGRWDLTAVGVNQVIGSGIFVLPWRVAVLVGAAASVLPFVGAGLANFVIVLCFAEAGSRFRTAGGPYRYADVAFGPFAGFQVAWMMWLTRVASQAALADAVSLYLGFFWDGATEGIGRVIVVTATIGILATVNLLGVRYGSAAVNLFTVAKLVPLTLFVLAGFLFIDWGRFAGIGDFTAAGFGRGVLLLMFAFGGYELITIPASEARSPERDAPRALLTTIAFVAGFYLLIQMVTVGTLATLETSETPLADAAGVFLGPAAGVFIAVGGLISIVGGNAGAMLAGPRITYALGEGRQLPSVFAHVNPRWRTPDFSIVVYAAVSLGLVLWGTFEQLAAVSAVARILFYIATCAAVPVLRRRMDPRGQAFELPGGPTIPALGLLICFAILFGAEWAEVQAAAVALVAGTALYLISGRR